MMHPPDQRSLPGVDRRRFLRGAGAVAVGLPLLPSATPRGRRFIQPLPNVRPVRLAFLFAPNGMLPSGWTIRSTDAHDRPTELPPTLEPLAPHLDQCIFPTGLRNKNSLTGEGHYVKTTAWLSGAPVHKTGGRDIRCGVTVDQAAARALGEATRIPSLELSLERPRFAEDMGYSTVYGAHISWRTPTLPATRELRPRRVFDRLFRSSQLGRDPSVASVLDVVGEDARGLLSKLDARDRDKLDEYLTAVRSVERRIERFADESSVGESNVEPSARPEFPRPEQPEEFAEQARLMLDLIVLAFRTDTTRIASMMFGNAVSGRDFTFLDGVKGSHHQLSHHAGEAEKQAMYQRINRWHVSQLAYLIEQLRRIDEGGSSLADQTAILFGSGIRDGNRHDPNNLPLVVAGRAGGAIRPGRLLACAKHRPLCDLHLALLRAFGVPAVTFGDSRQALDLS